MFLPPLRLSTLTHILRTIEQTAGKEGKQVGVPMESEAFVSHVRGLLADVQAALLAQATAFRCAWAGLNACVLHGAAPR